ncbi:ion channel [Kribbella deserti]|uniref:Ion channel n=1 Tax=Kribbella deserti TaxID=1926257 RepID=A0ABV6QYB3_9ACTN
MELLFLSFTTLSSTWLSDVVPVSPYGRSVVMLEQLAGLGYVAMVVSRLVCLTLTRRAIERSNKPKTGEVARVRGS